VFRLEEMALIGCWSYVIASVVICSLSGCEGRGLSVDISGEEKEKMTSLDSSSCAGISLSDVCVTCFSTSSPSSAYHQSACCTSDVTLRLCSIYCALSPTANCDVTTDDLFDSEGSMFGDVTKRDPALEMTAGKRPRTNFLGKRADRIRTNFLGKRAERPRTNFLGKRVRPRPRQPFLGR
jgi:hypothetical protein